MILAGDIGGTSTRLALFDGDATAVEALRLFVPCFGSQACASAVGQ
jgi:glucokinase